MSAPFIWIVLPGILAVGLFFLRNSERLMVILGGVASLWLALSAGVLPVGEVSSFGRVSFNLVENMFVLGREFILKDVDRPFIILMYLLQAGWIIGAWFARPSKMFVPFSFGMTAVLMAALAVEPFLYAALMIEVIVLLSIPLLAPPGLRPGRGVFRFLAFQTLGMVFILFTGWMMTGLEASPGDIEMVVRAGVLLGIGFAFLGAVFPFHSWFPLLAEESHPYIAAFIFFTLPGMVSLFGLGFLDRFVWLRDSEGVYELLRILGLVMTLVGGVWAAFETHLGRMLGHAAVAEMGLTLMAVGLGGKDGLVIYFWLMLPRAVAYILWATALSLVGESEGGNFRFDSVEGISRRQPIPAAAILLAHFTLSGIPLLPAFPSRLALWQGLAVVSPLIAGGAIAGSLGLLAGGLRTLSVFFIQPSKEAGPALDIPKPISKAPLEGEALLKWVLLSLSVAVLVFLGLFPNVYLSWLERFLLMFELLGT